MSPMEKLYLAMVLFLFASFIVLMGVLSWLDLKDDRIRRRRALHAAAQKTAAQKEAVVPGGAAVHH